MPPSGPAVADLPLNRVVVIGTSGSGKSVLTRDLAECLGSPAVETDAIYHQPDWEPLPTPEFERRIDAITGRDRWVIDGNYSMVRDRIWSRATCVVWLDLSRRVVMWRVISRTLRRGFRRRLLWNRNREELRNILERDPEHNIVLWAWTTFGPRRREYAAAMGDPRWAGVHWVRLRTRAEVASFVASCRRRGVTTPRHPQ